MALYQWNIAISGALFESIAIVEVVVRNELDRNLNVWAKRHVADWLDIIKFDEKAQVDIQKAHTRVSKESSHGKIVAELNFGFWRFMLGRRYLHEIWLPVMKSAFPNLEGHAGMRREEVERAVAKIWFLRNRIGHHEPIFNRDFSQDLVAMESLLNWISFEAASWARSQSRIDDVLKLKPQFPG